MKKNQLKLYEWIENQFEQYPPDSVADQIEQTRDRIMQRTGSVLETVVGLDATWVGVQRLIRVGRTGIRGVKPVHETIFYISSCCRCRGIEPDLRKLFVDVHCDRFCNHFRVTF